MKKAFVLGAGLGTRLRALTQSRPKPLIPIFGKPLITFAFDRLIESGVAGIAVNTHHCHQVYEETFPEHRYRGVPLEFVHEPVLLETAGGIKNVEAQMGGESFIVYNGDILSDLPLARALEQHRASGNEVTLVLRSTGEPLHVAMNAATGRITDIANRLGTAGMERYLFTGIYIIEPAFLQRIPERIKISVIPIFMEMIQSGHALGGVVIDEGQWWDLGTREKYLEVHLALAARGQHYRDGTAQVAADARLEGVVAMGPATKIEPGAQVTDCILWEGARVSAGSILERCILTTGKKAAGTHRDADF